MLQLSVVLVTYRLAFLPAEAAAPLKLLEKGVSKVCHPELICDVENSGRLQSFLPAEAAAPLKLLEKSVSKVCHPKFMCDVGKFCWEFWASPTCAPAVALLRLLETSVSKV